MCFSSFFFFLFHRVPAFSHSRIFFFAFLLLVNLAVFIFMLLVFFDLLSSFVLHHNRYAIARSKRKKKEKSDHTTNKNTPNTIHANQTRNGNLSNQKLFVLVITAPALSSTRPLHTHTHTHLRFYQFWKIK